MEKNMWIFFNSCEKAIEWNLKSIHDLKKKTQQSKNRNVTSFI